MMELDNTVHRTSCAKEAFVVKKQGLQRRACKEGQKRRNFIGNNEVLIIWGHPWSQAFRPPTPCRNSGHAVQINEVKYLNFHPCLIMYGTDIRLTSKAGTLGLDKSFPTCVCQIALKTCHVYFPL